MAFVLIDRCAPAYAARLTRGGSTPVRAVRPDGTGWKLGNDASIETPFGRTQSRKRAAGYAKEKTIQKFLAARYRKEQVTELLLGIALKTISNYLDHISPTPLDHALAGESK